MAYATLAEGRDDRELEELDIAIGMEEDPAEVAMAELRAFQEAAGMVFENPDEPVAPMPGTTDEEIRGEAW